MATKKTATTKTIVAKYTAPDHRGTSAKAAPKPPAKATTKAPKAAPKAAPKPPAKAVRQRRAPVVVAASPVAQASVPASSPDMKPTNPKDTIARGKLPLHLWPVTATAMGSLGMLEGREKYGRNNFRALGALASVYVDACKRHLDAWMEGEDIAPDSGVPHLANALSCLAILVDTQANGTLVDDRNSDSGYRALVNAITPEVDRIIKMHEGKNPKHYSRASK